MDYQTMKGLPTIDSNALMTTGQGKMNDERQRTTAANTRQQCADDGFTGNYG
jgi:hypothetical protein